MLPVQAQFEIPSAIRRTLDEVRRRLRAYLWLEGIALIAVLLGAAFWGGLLFDWLFEPSPAIRQAGWVVLAGVTVYFVYRYLLRRVFEPLSDDSLAQLLERRFPVLGDHVQTAVHLASSPREAATYNPAFVAQTQHAAIHAISDIEPARLFNRRPLVRVTLAAALVVMSILMFALVFQDAFGFYVKRLALSPEPWPRRVRLAVVGFPPDDAGFRTQKLAQDDDFELLVHAQTDGHEVPDEVEIRYELADGGRGRDTMIRVGEAVPSRDPFQIFRYKFERVAADMTFDVVGGDDRVENLKLKVVDRPQLHSIVLECTYPSYLRREAARLPVTGGMRIPEGTGVAVRAQSSKPLSAAHIRLASSGRDANLQLPGKSSELSWEYGTLATDDVLLITVTDTDGVSNREPYRISLSIVPDDVPQVAVRLDGIGTAVTPQATIPLVGKVTDEYGLDRLWFEYQIDDAPGGVRPLDHQGENSLAVSELGNFDLREVDETTGARRLTPQPGQKLKLTLKATDHFDLREGAREGASQPFTLDIVTDADLLALIERRELELRQRFEAIYEKVTDTRNMLARVEFGDQAGATEPDADSGSETENASPESVAARALALRRLRVSGAEQNVTQSGDEIMDISEGFDDIHNQLTNNRIDNADLKSRLREQIALPLRAIGSSRMPELQASLKLVEEHLTDELQGEAALEASVALADEILVDMKQVLDRMLELETYNEVVTLLRGIITDQEELNRRTKERQKERLQNLLE